MEYGEGWPPRLGTKVVVCLWSLHIVCIIVLVSDCNSMVSDLYHGSITNPVLKLRLTVFILIKRKQINFWQYVSEISLYTK